MDKVYGVFNGEYSDWNCLGFFTDEQDGIWDYFGSLRSTLVRINSTWIERLVFKINGDIVI